MQVRDAKAVVPLGKSSNGLPVVTATKVHQRRQPTTDETQRQNLLLQGLCAPSIFVSHETSHATDKPQGSTSQQQQTGWSADEAFGKVLLAQAIANDQNQRL
jgi:hypothetical protein